MPVKLQDCTYITLCGSSRFKTDFEGVNRILTLGGHVVYSLGVFAHHEESIAQGNKAFKSLTPQQKEVLDKVHFKKILNSDAIFVINVNRYIGESTRKEIEFAEMNGIHVFYMSDFFK